MEIRVIIIFIVMDPERIMGFIYIYTFMCIYIDIY